MQWPPCTTDIFSSTPSKKLMDIDECVENTGVHHRFQVILVDVISSCSSVSFVLEYLFRFPLLTINKKW